MSEHHSSTNIKTACEAAALVNGKTESRIVLEGRDGLDLLHRLSTNDLVHWSQTRMTATALTTEKGRIVDTVRVVQYGTGHLLFGSADAEQEVLRWITKYTIADDVAVRSITDSTRMWMLVGPDAEAIAGTIGGGGESGIGVFPDETTSLKRVYILEMGDSRPLFRERIGHMKIPLLSDREWETVRVLHGVPASGHELDAKFNPFDVGLDRIISRTKGCYIGQEVLARIETYHKNRKTLAGFSAATPNTLKVGGRFDSGGVDAGQITSIAPVRVGGRVIGLASISGDLTAAGTVLTSEGGDAVTIEELPMVRVLRTDDDE